MDSRRIWRIMRLEIETKQIKPNIGNVKFVLEQNIVAAQTELNGLEIMLYWPVDGKVGFFLANKEN